MGGVGGGRPRIPSRISPVGGRSAEEKRSCGYHMTSCEYHVTVSLTHGGKAVLKGLEWGWQGLSGACEGVSGGGGRRGSGVLCACGGVHGEP